MKVYVVLENWVVDYDSGSTMEVYDTKEKALEDFNERIRNARIDMNFNADEDEQIEESDMKEDKDEDSYCIYEDGYYSSNHISIRIEEKEVK